MKKELEVQRAHDLLAPLATGEIRVPQIDRHDVAPFATALCWVLDDPNAKDFAGILTHTERTMAQCGYQLGSPLPFPMNRRPGGEIPPTLEPSKSQTPPTPAHSIELEDLEEVIEVVLPIGTEGKPRIFLDAKLLVKLLQVLHG